MSIDGLWLKWRKYRLLIWSPFYNGVVRPYQFPCHLGVDVGGTTIKIGIVDNSGGACYGKIDTNHERGPEDGVRRIIELAEGLLAESGLNWEQIRAIGLGTPGTMDEAGYMPYANMSGWMFSYSQLFSGPDRQTRHSLRC